MNRYTFRFDDISLNTDEEKLRNMLEFLTVRFRSVDELTIILAVSPAVHSMSTFSGLERERVFPRMLHIESDFRKFYKVDKIGIPSFVKVYDRRPEFQVAAHGMIHVDHRLLSRGAQEMSILTSCALLRTNRFVPPFHKWNKKTQEICSEHSIILSRFEDHDWKHLGLHPFVTHQMNYYLHTHDLTYEQFVGKFS